MQWHRRILVPALGALLAFAPAAWADDDDDSLDFAIQSELQFGGTWLEPRLRGTTSIDDHRYPMLSGNARASIPLIDILSLQLDIEGLSNFTSRRNGEDNLHDFFGGGGHITYRDPDAFAAGVFSTFGSSSGGENENAKYWLVGAEAQGYIGNTTLYGQTGYFEGDDETENDTMTDAWFVRMAVRQFINENHRIGVEGSYASGEDNKGGSAASDIDMGSWEARYDYGIPNTPVGVFLGYSGMKGELESPSPEGFIEHTVFIGATFTFGYEQKLSLLQNDRRGATFDGPPIGHWTGYTLEVIDN